MLRVGVLVSGRGTNLQALLDAQGDDYRVVVVGSNRPGVLALARAAAARVPTAVFEGRAAQGAMAERLRRARVGLVVLAGFDRILTPEFFAALGGVPVISTHPSLLPRFGGRGMIGLRVHEAVLAVGERETGCTIFRVGPASLDEGEVLLQRRVPVLAGDTPESLEARVLPAEHAALVEVVRRFARERPA